MRINSFFKIVLTGKGRNSLRFSYLVAISPWDIRIWKTLWTALRLACHVRLEYYSLIFFFKTKMFENTHLKQFTARWTPSDTNFKHISFISHGKNTSRHHSGIQPVSRWISSRLPQSLAHLGHGFYLVETMTRGTVVIFTYHLRSGMFPGTRQLNYTSNSRRLYSSTFFVYGKM